MNIHNQYPHQQNYPSQQQQANMQPQMRIHQQLPPSANLTASMYQVTQHSNANIAVGGQSNTPGQTHAMTPAAPSSGPSCSTPSSSITKEQIKDYLRQWIRVENEIGTLTQEIKKRKLIHQQLSASLMEVMRKNEIDCFDITNGKIVYSKTKTRPPLNKAQLKNALLTYYKDDKDTASSLNEFLIASRVEKVREAIKMKIPK
jgi:hypothetical protein